MTKRTWMNLALSGLIFAPGLALASATPVDSSATSNAESSSLPKLSLDPPSQPDKPDAAPQKNSY